ncbi:hypothetical protein SO802_017589 [Lithocarpus litseifolius]|uniref:Retropepsins domain-containing protein n=1 Tax=Lithocarpus litseifolius TaxID=425828 RepID=A0AAW2CIQ8_9ROSI
MHVMVKCEDMIVSRVLIDNGSTLNVCPMSTVERLNVNTSLICPTTMIVRAFDGNLREVKGEIELAIRIGPMFFMVNFQVIKVDSPYNTLLRRPWLHTAGAIASTLHQRLKFPSKDKMITIMDEKPLTIFKETSIPYIGANAFSKATFHNFELGPFFGFDQGHQIKNGTGIMRRGISSSLSQEFSVNAIISLGDDLTSTIPPYVPGETVGHWTIEPYFVVAPAE